MRSTALSYLWSLICHGIVLVPLAYLPVRFETLPTFTVSHGSPAVLMASLSSPQAPMEREIQVTLESAFQLELPLSEKAASLEAIRQLPTITRNRPAVMKADLLGAQPNELPAMPRRVPLTLDAQRMFPEAKSPSRQTTPRRSTRVITGIVVSARGASFPSEGAEVNEAPRSLASNPVPPYPSDALARGIEGLVLLRVHIGADGAIKEASIHRSSGDQSLDQSALSTVRDGWRFLPAARNGNAVPYEAILPIRFTIRAG